MGKPQGLPRAERITRRRDFDRVFAEGRQRGGPLLVVRYLPNGLTQSRLGVALGRRWRGAVARNRAKRLIREAFRTHKRSIPKGIDLVVIPRVGWDPPGAEAIASELSRLLRQASEER